MIIGNKCDMEDKRGVETERGEEVAKNHGIPFLETSAKTNVNVTRAFHDMALRILEKQPDKKPEMPNINPSKPFNVHTPSSNYGISYKPNCC